MSDIHNVFHVS
jgi:hypothetical protein